MLIPIVVGAACISLVGLAVYAEIRDKNESSRHLAATVAAVMLAYLFYPMTIVPVGDTSNGGILGLGSLVRQR
jgi:hypothetical protein